MSAQDHLSPQQFAKHMGSASKRPSLRDRLGVPHLEAKHRGAPEGYEYFGEKGLKPQ